MKELYIGLTIALVSGITFLAYKHPKGYKKMYPWILGLLFIGIFIVTIYNYGVDSGYLGLIPSISVDKQHEAASAIADKKIPDWYLLVSLLGTLYALFLKALPIIIEDKVGEKDLNQAKH